MEQIKKSLKSLVILVQMLEQTDMNTQHDLYNAIVNTLKGASYELNEQISNYSPFNNL